jgi:cytoskeleton protein RodZ
MNEDVLRSTDGLPAQQSTGVTRSAGAMLREAREAQGLHIGALAVSLKVPVKKIEALEGDRYDLLPDVVFVRALAASVCRTLKIASDPVLKCLPNTSVPRLTSDEAGINVPFRAPGSGTGMTFRDQFSKPFVLAILMLLVGALVLLLLPVKPLEQSNSTLDTATTARPEAKVAPVVTEKQNTTETGPQVPSPSLTLASSEVLAAAGAAAQVASATAFIPSDAKILAPILNSEATSSVLLLKARGPSWVEVIDANRVVQVRKTIANGEVVTASGATPLLVAIGRADNIEVLVRGKPFDLLKIARDNVARFEVK